MDLELKKSLKEYNDAMKGSIADICQKYEVGLNKMGGIKSPVIRRFLKQQMLAIEKVLDEELKNFKENN